MGAESKDLKHAQSSNAVGTFSIAESGLTRLLWSKNSRQYYQDENRRGPSTARQRRFAQDDDFVERWGMVPSAAKAGRLFNLTAGLKAPPLQNKKVTGSERSVVERLLFFNPDARCHPERSAPWARSRRTSAIHILVILSRVFGPQKPYEAGFRG
jgi:hypothetical protein